MNRVVWITGASRGIGAETARLFAMEGYGVAAGYCGSAAAAEAVVAEARSLGVNAHAVCADLRTEAGCRAFAREAEARVGMPDALVNNAGACLQKLVTDTGEEESMELFALNFHAARRLCAHVLGHMYGQRYGRIVNVSSMWGQCGASMESVYAASKAALLGFTRSLAKEAGPMGVTVNAVAPGVIDTDMNAHLDADTLAALAAQTPVGRLGTPADVARACVFLASEGAGFITGQTLGVSGGFYI